MCPQLGTENKSRFTVPAAVPGIIKKNTNDYVVDLERIWGWGDTGSKGGDALPCLAPSYLHPSLPTRTYRSLHVYPLLYFLYFHMPLPPLILVPSLQLSPPPFLYPPLPFPPRPPPPLLPPLPLLPLLLFFHFHALLHLHRLVQNHALLHPMPSITDCWLPPPTPITVKTHITVHIKPCADIAYTKCTRNHIKNNRVNIVRGIVMMNK